MGEFAIILLAVLIVVLSGIMVFAKSPISSAFSLVLLMLCLAAIYAIIGAHFVAALQAIVYAGAVMVLFVFSIMLLNMNEDKSEVSLTSWRTLAGFGTVSVLFLFLTHAFFKWSIEPRLPKASQWTLAFIKEQGGNVVTVSGTLFSQNFIQFEIISLLLLVAMAAALVLAKRKAD